MSMMSEIHAAMTVDGVIDTYETDAVELDRVTEDIDALRVATFADETEYAAQMSQLHDLQLRRLRIRARMTRTFDRYAGRVARAGA